MTDTDSLEISLIEAVVKASALADPERPWSDEAIMNASVDQSGRNAIIARAAIAAVRRWEAENGYRCVPLKWTPEMWEVWTEHDGGGEEEFISVMAASPTPPGAQGSDKGDGRHG